jgi:hypothetical protein
MNEATEYRVKAVLRATDTVIEDHEGLSPDECTSKMLTLWLKYPDRERFKVYWQVTKREA